MTPPDTQGEGLRAAALKLCNHLLSDDHKRLCEGRQYTCECGYDATTDQLANNLIDVALSALPVPVGGIERERLATMLEQRIGQDFEGECHLAEHEAREVISVLLGELGRLGPAAGGGHD